jgi:hypothetical protein
MADQTIPSLTETTSLQRKDLLYVAKKSLQGGFADRQASMIALARFIRIPQTEEKSSNYVIQASECDKRWFSNKDATSGIQFSLPTAADGLEVGFVIETADDITVVPQALDTLFPTGVTDGTALTASVLGSAIYLRGFSEGWCILSEVGTWSTV